MKLINRQKSDIIVFTGDMVNNRANELDRWKDIISTLKAKVEKKYFPAQVADNVEISAPDFGGKVAGRCLLWNVSRVSFKRN